MAYKIIGVDNFNTETVSDYLVCENIESKNYAETICQAMNAKFSGETAPRFFKVVDQSHLLYTWSP